MKYFFLLLYLKKLLFILIAGCFALSIKYGISKENITKIFKYGFSTKKDDESDSLGHRGIGLHLTLKLAALNDIKVYIKTNENGTMFVLGFPIIIYDNSIEPSNESDVLHKLYVINEYENKDYDKNITKYNKLKKESSSKLKNDS